MPPYANMQRPRMPVSRSGTGVAQGGQTGRPPSLHMGTASARSGGPNASGSARSFFARAAGAPPGFGGPAGKLGPAKGSLGALGSAKSPYASKLANKFAGQSGKFTPAKTGALGSLAKTTTYSKPAAAPGPANPTTPIGTLDPRDAQYGRDMARSLYDYEMGTSGIPVMQKQFELGAYDLTKNRDRSQYDSNADLASRGIYNSGSRVNADADIANDYTRDYYGLRAEHGDIAQDALRSRYGTRDAEGRISGGLYGLEQDQAYANAMGRYPTNNPTPTAPIQQAVAANNTSGAITGWKAAKGAWFSRGPGVWGYINPSGMWVNATKAPPAGANIIGNPLRKF